MTLHHEYQEGKVLLVDKPLGWTSFQAVNKIKRTLIGQLGLPKRFKIGHAGTLDPLATGLLVICTGKFTKRIDQFQAEDKEYTGTFTLGATRPSYDMETEIDGTYDISGISHTDIERVTVQFLGEIEQFPPAHSAIKIGGERVYEKARRGETVEMKARRIRISQFEITDIELPIVRFRVVCSKGTYIRSLADDFGKALGSGAYLSELRRTKSGSFTVDEAWQLDALVQTIRSTPKDPE